MKLYLGLLNIDKMNSVQKRAYKAWKDQGQRCGNPNNPRFYCYGAIGIRRLHSSREFIGWYESEYLKFSNVTHRMQCGRIDHSKNYTLDNIQLETVSENTSERNHRWGNPCSTKIIFATNAFTGERREFNGKRVAARELGLSRHAISNQLNKKITRKPSSGWIFSEN